MKKLYIIFLVFLLSGCVFVPRPDSQDLGMQHSRFQGKLRLGMTREQVKKNWGEPDKIIKKSGENFNEIWIYIPHWKLKNYLYFKDGILVDGLRNNEI